jgi:hypothetical protein
MVRWLLWVDDERNRRGVRQNNSLKEATMKNLEERVEIA